MEAQAIIALICAAASAANAYALLLIKVELGKVKTELLERIHTEAMAANTRFAPAEVEDRVLSLERRKC